MDAGNGHTYKCHTPPDKLLALQQADAPMPDPEPAPAD
jgi:hypothetical protein